MAISGTKSAPAPSIPATERREYEREDGGSVSRLEDRVDYLTICHARATARAKGEKSMAWSKFKKKLSK